MTKGVFSGMKPAMMMKKFKGAGRAAVGIFLFLNLFFGGGAVFASAPPENAEGIILEPKLLFQGGICRVTVYPQEGYKVKSANFAANPLILKKMADGGYTGIIGAGLKERPGRKRLTVKLFSDQGVSRVLSRKILVKQKKYPEEHLKVSKKMVEFPPPILRRVLADQQAVRNACSRVTSMIYWDLPFIWPVNSRILSPFGLHRFFNGQPRSPHSGVDLRARTGTVIKAPNHGRVVLVRDCYLSGNTVVIDHGGGLFTLYAHLSQVGVKKGEMVKKGEVIGLAGATGRATGPHLHWGVSLNGVRVDPAMLMELFGS